MSQFVGFGSPASILTGGQTFSTDPTNINDGAGGFTGVTPPPVTTGVPTPAPTGIQSLVGPNGFLDADQSPASGQNIVTDPNVVGVTTPGMTTYGPDSLANPLANSYGMPSLDRGYVGSDNTGLNATGTAQSNC